MSFSCAPRPLEETVTTDAGRSSTLPVGAQPVVLSPNLPSRDADIEAAGDSIAAAITYLNSRRRDRRESALRALEQAEAVLNRAQRDETRNEETRAAFQAVRTELATAERAVQRNAPEATKQLDAIDKHLDEINIKTIPAESRANR